jgi:signal transduction histidine kinase
LDLEEVPFSLRTCIEGAFDLLAPRAAEKSLELLYRRESDVPDTFVGDLTRLRQILVNLLSNAVKFTKIGEIVVSVDLKRLDNLDAPVDEGFYVISFSVKDTGMSSRGWQRVDQRC